MAITIIKGGRNEFVGHCKWCGCEFRYHEEDVTNNPQPPRLQFCSVDCPFCKRQLEHIGEHGTSWVGTRDTMVSAYAQHAAGQQTAHMNGPGYRKYWEVK